MSRYFLIPLLLVILANATGCDSSQPPGAGNSTGDAARASTGFPPAESREGNPSQKLVQESTLATLEKAAEQGDADAQDRLGLMYAKGEGVPKDMSKAAEWLQKAAEQGHDKAQLLLGLMYAMGDGVPKDSAKAVEWYRKAAEQGNAIAQFLLGGMYADGEGVAKDTAKAVEWYRKAAEQGNADAQFILGWMYADGEGVPKDAVLGYAWLNLAAGQGNENAAEKRNRIERQMTAAQLAEAQGLSSGWQKGKNLTRNGSDDPGAAAPGVAGTRKKIGSGTVFVVSQEGYAVTNYHMVEKCAELRIAGRDEVVQRITDDMVNDLALLKIPGSISRAAMICADPAKLRQGENITVFGFPLNTVLASGGNLTPGVVSALSGLGNNTSQIQITAPIQPGSSGSPVLNRKGEVVGVVSMKLSDSKMAKATGSVGQNVNFAVSGQTLKTFLDTNRVSYRSGGLFVFDKNDADLADEARKWTFVMECWK